jgi:hypothetical protein
VLGELRGTPDQLVRRSARIDEDMRLSRFPAPAAAGG